MTNSSGLLRGILQFFGLCFAMCVPVVCIAEDVTNPVIRPYTAVYDFTTNDSFRSDATRRLERQGASWLYSFNSKVLKIGKANEQSSFLFDGKQLTSLQHDRGYKILMKSHVETQILNASTKQITLIDDKDRKMAAWQPNVLDELNIELQMRVDLLSNAFKNNYKIVSKDGVEVVPFKKLGTEKISTPLGVLDTVKIERVHQNKNRTTFFWLAPTLNFLPVRIEHKGKDGAFKLVIKRFNYDS